MKQKINNFIQTGWVIATLLTASAHLYADTIFRLNIPDFYRISRKTPYF